MVTQTVTLRTISRDDVKRIRQWLDDPEVSDNWFGRYSYGDPAHLGYHPERIENASDEEWRRIFDDPENRMMSVYTSGGEHIGEVHIVIEESLGDGQISILIGRKDLWHQGYGTAAIRATLKRAFTDWGLFRVWVDVPEYNTAAIALFERNGFTHEGTLRKSRPHHGARFDSVVMGMLSAEYAESDDGGTQSASSD